MQLWVEGDFVGELSVPYPRRGQSNIRLQVMNPHLPMSPSNVKDVFSHYANTYEYRLDIQRRRCSVDDILLESDSQALAKIYEHYKISEVNISRTRDKFRQRTILSWDVLTCDRDTYEAIFDDDSFAPA